jgi:hypothetical protein
MCYALKVIGPFDGMQAQSRMAGARGEGGQRISTCVAFHMGAASITLWPD